MPRERFVGPERKSGTWKARKAEEENETRGLWRFMWCAGDGCWVLDIGS